MHVAGDDVFSLDWIREGYRELYRTQISPSFHRHIGRHNPVNQQTSRPGIGSRPVFPTILQQRDGLYRRLWDSPQV